MEVYAEGQVWSRKCVYFQVPLTKLPFKGNEVVVFKLLARCHYESLICPCLITLYSETNHPCFSLPFPTTPSTHSHPHPLLIWWEFCSCQPRHPRTFTEQISRNLESVWEGGKAKVTTENPASFFIILILTLILLTKHIISFMSTPWAFEICVLVSEYNLNIPYWWSKTSN